MAGEIGVAVIGAGMAGRAHLAGYRTAPTLFDPPLPPLRYVAAVDANEAVAVETPARQATSSNRGRSGRSVDRYVRSGRTPLLSAMTHLPHQTRFVRTIW